MVEELARRGWLNKHWQTRKGRLRGGQPFNKSSLHHLLTNVLYVGQVPYKNEVHAGEHPAIVDKAVWNQVQELLRRQDPARGSPVRNESHALLKGLLRCRPCGCAMTPTQACKNSKRYRYYVCLRALKRGQQACPARSVPAAAIETFVLGQLQGLAKEQGWDLPAWGSLPAEEQARQVQRWVERVDYDGAQDKVAITFQAHVPEDGAEGRKGHG